MEGLGIVLNLKHQYLLKVNEKTAYFGSYLLIKAGQMDNTYQCYDIA